MEKVRETLALQHERRKTEMVFILQINQVVWLILGFWWQTFVFLTLLPPPTSAGVEGGREEKSLERDDTPHPLTSKGHPSRDSSKGRPAPRAFCPRWLGQNLLLFPHGHVLSSLSPNESRLSPKATHLEAATWNHPGRAAPGLPSPTRTRNGFYDRKTPTYKRDRSFFSSLK